MNNADMLQLIADGKFTGIVRDLEGKHYYPAPALSFSGMTEMEVSPAHYQASIFIERRVSPAMRLGTLVHAAVLEPARFSRDFVVAPVKEVHPEILDTVEQLKAKCESLGLKVTGRKAELIERIKEKEPATKFWDEFLEQMTGGKEVVSADEMAKIEGMADAILSHKFASQLFTLAEKEVSGFHVHESGLVRKGRADAMIQKSGVLGDLKVSGVESIFRSSHAMAKHLYDSRYHWQAAWYLDLFSDLTGKKFEHFANVFVQSDACMRVVKPGTFPKLTFPVVVPRLMEASLDLARQQYAPLIDKYLECKRTGEWPGFSEQISDVNVPEWAFSHGEV